MMDDFLNIKCGGGGENEKTPGNPRFFCASASGHPDDPTRRETDSKRSILRPGKPVLPGGGATGSAGLDDG